MAWKVHDGVEIWLIKRYWTHPVEYVIKARVSLSTETVKALEGCLASYFAIVNYFLRQHETADSIATVDANIETFK